ncbi:LytTR family DNA-binding domain-containing protein [Niabella yanshanensis]|uniref:LytTR family DNA-binding domain-containing protein n=1 Tax=Niabella yanshanensis TaxID=577386 RepID=A0ABZ0W9V2_9BACT|nr:LytTR family DNA-binding domain-containing protein [Niabella yanshanensis]WQD38770.1 LytTR family DNA-binding domain-containing protein [Niabella yanshanensis]
MSKRSVLIIDDEEPGRRLVRQYLEPYANFRVIGECANGLEAVRDINFMEPDLIFLDVQMPGAGGLEVLKRVEHIPHVIFTTAYDRYAIDAFEANAVDYLLKPYTRERFEKTMTRLEQQDSSPAIDVINNLLPQEGFADRILVEHRKRYKNIPVAEILYLKACGDHTEIYTKTVTYLSSMGISSLAEKLNPRSYVRLHRSTLVNMNHVKEVYRDLGKIFVVMQNGVELSVGRNYQPLIKELMV